MKLKIKGAQVERKIPLGMMMAVHVGPKLANAWFRRLQAVRYREIPRLLAMREGIPESLAPELYPASISEMDIQSPEGLAEADALFREILAEASFRLQIEDITLNGQEAIDEAERLGILDPSARFCIEAQRPEVEDSLSSGGAVGEDTASGASPAP